MAYTCIQVLIFFPLIFQPPERVQFPGQLPEQARPDVQVVAPHEPEDPKPIGRFRARKCVRDGQPGAGSSETNSRSFRGLKERSKKKESAQ